MKSSKFLTMLGLTTVLTVSGVNILPFASTESLVNSSKAEAAIWVDGVLPIVSQSQGTPSQPSILVASNTNYQQFRLQTGTALHETGDSFDFAVLSNGDLMAIKKSSTGSGKTEVHILRI
ncbi:MAG: hypothetical protein ACK5RT_00005 [Dolichospermum sp.]